MTVGKVLVVAMRCPGATKDANPQGKFPTDELDIGPRRPVERWCASSCLPMA